MTPLLQLENSLLEMRFRRAEILELLIGAGVKWHVLFTILPLIGLLHKAGYPSQIFWITFRLFIKVVLCCESHHEIWTCCVVELTTLYTILFFVYGHIWVSSLKQILHFQQCVGDGH